MHIISWEFGPGSLQTALCIIQLAEGSWRAFFNLDLPIKYAAADTKLHVLDKDVSYRKIPARLKGDEQQHGTKEQQA